MYEFALLAGVTMLLAIVIAAGWATAKCLGTLFCCACCDDEQDDDIIEDED